MTILRRWTRRKRPPSGTPLARPELFGRRVVACLPYNEGGGLPLELVAGTPPAFSSGMTLDSLGLQCSSCDLRYGDSTKYRTSGQAVTLFSLFSTTSVSKGLLGHGGGAWYLRVNSTGKPNFLRSWTADIGSGTISVNDGAVHAVCATNTAANAWKIFVDGAACGSGTWSGSWAYSDPLYVGCDDSYSGTEANFTGLKLLDLVIDGALTDAEAQALCLNPWQVFSPVRRTIFTPAVAPPSGSSYSDSIAESASASDALSAAASLAASASEALSCSDACAEALSALASLAEAVAASEAASASLSVVAEAAEGASLSDACSALSGAVLSVSESGSISDALSWSAVVSAAVSEEQAATDSFAAAAAFLGALAEASDSGDTASSSVAALASVIESATPGDVVVVLPGDGDVGPGIITVPGAYSRIASVQGVSAPTITIVAVFRRSQ